MIGKKFNRLTAVAFSHKEKIRGQKGYHHFWKFRCKCGNIHIARLSAVKCGQTKSCGCLMIENVKRANTKHNMSHSRLYQIWGGMRMRCNNPNASKYNIYGGLGIKCLWDTFEQFYTDMATSYYKHCETFSDKQTTLDRINSEGHYCKDNCKWSTYSEQRNNPTNRIHST